MKFSTIFNIFINFLQPLRPFISIKKASLLIVLPVSEQFRDAPLNKLFGEKKSLRRNLIARLGNKSQSVQTEWEKLAKFENEICICTFR